MASTSALPAKLSANASRLTFVAISLVVIAIDQLTKELAIANLRLGEQVSVLGELLSWRLVYNDSAAFSIGFGLTWILSITSTIAALTTIWYGMKIRSLSWSIIAGIFLGGVTGNLIDRITREPGFAIGHVVDFIQIPFNFPVFNLADIAIVSMASLAVLRVFRGENLGGLPGKSK